MKKTIKRAAVLGLSVCLALTSLAGCSKKETFDMEAEAIKVNETVVPAGLVKFMAHYTQAATESFYAAYFGPNAFDQKVDESGATLGDMVIDGSVTQLKQMVLAEQKMEEYGVTVSDEEKAAIDEAAAAFLEANDKETMEKMGATEDTVARFLELYTIKQKIEPLMSADIDTEVSDEEAAQRKIEYVFFAAETEAETEATTEATTEAETAEDTAETETEAETAAETAVEEETVALTEEDAAKTQSADETETELVTEAAQTEGTTEAETAEAADETETETETETEDPAMAAAKEKAFAQAAELIAKVEAGEDMEEAAKSVKEDAKVSTMTFGADDTSVTEALKTATEGVADGTLIGEPVEASSGYYAVRLVTQLDREATDAKKESIVSQRERDRIAELYNEWEEAAEISQNDEIISKIVFDFSLVPETEAQTEADTEAGAEADTAAEADTEAGTEADTAAEADTEAVTE